jgi:hypothetical protein
MMFSFMGIIWRSVPLLSEINYPWTLLSQLGLITAFFAGYLVLEGRIYKYLTIVLVILAVILTVGYAKPESFNNNSDQYYLTNEATTTSSDELMPIWVTEKPLSRFVEKVEVIKGEASISDLEYDSNNISFSYEATSNPSFQINTIYYPGWKAYVNGVPTGIDYDNPKGVMIVNSDIYSNKVYLNFGETLERTLANGISIVSLLVLLFIMLRPLLLFKK